MNCNSIDIHSQLAYIVSMIYCVCNNITTKAIDAAAAKGAETAQCVQKACHSEFNCGQCRADIDARLKTWRRENELVMAAE